MIIGLSGYGGVGKDEVGRILVENYGYARFAKGDLIKTVALGINPTVSDDRAHTYTLYQIVTLHGWEYAKKNPMVRRFLQNLADEMVKVCGRDIWNDALYQAIDASGYADVVLTRLSLPIECGPLGERGGQVWRIERPGYGPANDHPNEIALDGYPFDAIIVNDGTTDDLADKIAALL